jgi:MFS family permease
MGVGALAAGIALSTSGAVLALVVDLATFVVAALLYWTIRVRPGAQVLDQADSGLRAGFRYLLRRKALLVVVCAFAAATLATGLTNATLPRFLDGELHMGAGAYGYGLSALAWGLAAGQAVVGFTRVGHSASRWIGAALIAMAVLFVTLAETTHAPTALLVLALIGFVDGTTDVLFDTIVQREADPRYYGRVFGFASAFITTTMMTAVAASPLLNHVGTPRAVILFAGLFLLVAAAVALVGTRRPAGAEALAAGVGSR